MSRLEKGYYAALGDSVDFTGVYEWLYSYNTLIRDGKEFEGTKDAMFGCIKKAIPFIKEIEFNSKYHEFEVLVDFEDGQPVERKLASFLSDGMKAVLNMVAEIAYRCVLLNGKLGQNAIVDSPGIVLIDEIDMHLHPKWQKRIVADLKNAFPKLQFIVTTHSPFIVQSLKSDELLILDFDKVEGLDEDPNRHSIEEVSTGEMGVPNVERSQLFLKMQNEAKEYFDLIKNKSDKESIAKAKRKLDELRIRFNSDPAYVALLESEMKES
ncbi:AAA family ATPase [Flavihumibacter sp. UBA7668]|uniref:AAA family ATPase n=1 Tax=Flavihumibacter sp. UBA7668 TaxID=1946542 RepID=UPI0025C64B90|nr:AAA family ATPase [Flavihumibacter sp. UBA7668]